MFLLLSYTDFNIEKQFTDQFYALVRAFNKTAILQENFTSNISETCAKHDVSFLFIAIQNKKKYIQKALNECRELRIPYTFITENTKQISFGNIIAPIGFLEEEVEKAHYLSHIVRFLNADITLLRANDVGSRAEKNTNKICVALDKFELKYKVEIAKKDSFKVEYDGLELANKKQAGLLIILASRDYGLDDILFGPKERHIILKSTTPVMLINPRADLYTLCD